MAVNVAIFGAFLLMTLVFGFFLWQTLFASKENGHREPQAKPAYSEQQRGSENALGTSPAPSHSNPAEEAIADYTRWLAIFTMFLVLATIGLFISGERNVEVANRSADAANRSAQIANDSLIQTQRAFIVPFGIEADSKGPDASTVAIWRFSMRYQNAGNTFTKNFDNWIEAKYFESEPPDDFDFSKPAEPPAFIMDIGPKAFFNSAHREVPIGQVMLAAQGRGGIIVWGQASYNDVFSGTERHTLDFCLVARFVGDVTKPGIPGRGGSPFEFRACKHGANRSR